jgi:hypothetical protein
MGVNECTKRTVTAGFPHRVRLNRSTLIEAVPAHKQEDEQVFALYQCAISVTTNTRC